MFNTIKEFLRGKKTVLASISLIITAAIAWSQGQIGDIECIRMVIEALIAMAIRDAIGK